MRKWAPVNQTYEGMERFRENLYKNMGAEAGISVKQPSGKNRPVPGRFWESSGGGGALLRYGPLIEDHSRQDDEAHHVRGVAGNHHSQARDNHS